MTAETQTPKRPALRYHGGKFRLGKWIISHFPTHRVYVEPFGGGASVLLLKPRSYAEVYNDLDGEVVNLFRVLRDHGAELRIKVELTPFSRADFDESYEPTADPLERARRLLVRSWMGFGSNVTRPTLSGRPQRTGFRTCTTRVGTTPAADWRNYPESMLAVIERLRGVVIEQRQACEVMAAHDSETTLHYVDPPYVSDTRDKGSDYRAEMTDVDHCSLAAFLKTLKGAVIVSGYDCQLYRDLFASWDRRECKTHADGARERVECLWLRNIDPDLFNTHS